jgi:aspartyl-tRNA(Asn)/glutamyl-tRNA(Gln) amidotransferase subunit A
VTGAGQLAREVAAGARDPVEVVEGALRALEARTDLNAVLALCPERALARARAGPRGRLAGVPLLVKDLVDTAGVVTTYGSPLHAGHVPVRTAPAVRALEAEGAIVVGKANLDEFAWGVVGQNAHFGDVVNPAAPDRIAGGSSGGNAAALAAGLVPLGLGTDTGGSVRLPAACCGVVGLKGALGAIPTAGVHPLAPSFDTVGPMARSVADCVLAQSVLTGRPVPVPRLEGLVVGALVAHPDIGAPAPGRPEREARGHALAARLEALGARAVEVELPTPEADPWPVFQAEAAAVHRATFPARAEAYGANVRAKLADAQRVDAARVASGRAALRGWRERAARQPAVDLVVTPALGMPGPPPAGVDELAVRVALSAYTRPFNYLGWPAIAIGDLQLAGRDEGVVLAAALALEEGGALSPPATAA